MGSFNDVVHAIEVLLKTGFPVKMQTIIGKGNIDHLEDLVTFMKAKDWLSHPKFQWRIEGSHDYANLDQEKDEISEGTIVAALIHIWNNNQDLHDKMKFENFKYLGHITRSFGWLGEYKTYWGPRFTFCEPQKGLQFVFSTDGKIYHCPRSTNRKRFQIGDITARLTSREVGIGLQPLLMREDCAPCTINTLCGGGCIVQKTYYPEMDCKEYGISIIAEYIALMKKEILERAVPGKATSINELWI